MAEIQLNFSNDPQLTGAAVGDFVYYIDSGNITGGSGNILGTNSSLNNVIFMGKIVAFFGAYNIAVDTDPDGDGIGLSFTMPTANDYVFFSKSNEQELSSLLGYYAETQLVNNSTDKAELFSVAIEVEQSSK